MGRNAALVARAALDQHLVRGMVEDTVRLLREQHPGHTAETVRSVVAQAAGELLGSTSVPTSFLAGLRRRAAGRLHALHGTPIPIARRPDR